MEYHLGDPSVVKPSQARVSLLRDDTYFLKQWGKKRRAAGKKFIFQETSIRRPVASSPKPLTPEPCHPVVVPGIGTRDLTGVARNPFKKTPIQKYSGALHLCPLQ